MSVWLSGVVFLLCCEKINGKTSEPEFCPLAKMSGHCDKAGQANSNSLVIETANETCADGCGFLPVVFDKTRKIEQNRQHTAPASNIVPVQFSPPALAEFTARPDASYSRLASSCKIFVINCTFRI